VSGVPTETAVGSGDRRDSWGHLTEHQTGMRYPQVRLRLNLRALKHRACLRNHKTLLLDVDEPRLLYPTAVLEMISSLGLDRINLTSYYRLSAESPTSPNELRLLSLVRLMLK
jgi:hypothetical protein